VQLIHNGSGINRMSKSKIIIGHKHTLYQEKIYHLVAGDRRLTSYPMDHNKCMIMRSKFIDSSRIKLEEIKGNE